MTLETLALQIAPQHVREGTPDIVRDISFDIGNVGFSYGKHLPSSVKQRGVSTEQRKLYLKDGPYVEVIGVTVQDGSREPFSEIMIQANNYVNRRGIWYKRNIDLFLPFSRGEAYICDLRNNNGVLAQLFAEKWSQGDFKNDDWHIFRGKYRKVEDLEAFLGYVLNRR